MLLGSQQVVQSHLGAELWNVHLKQTSRAVSAEMQTPRQILELMGNFHGCVKGSLGTDEFFERRTIIKKGTEIAPLVFSKEF